jgi:hypothetical protein
MSYIISSSNPFVSVKLTEIGREKLASGALNFSFWAIGDSEIDYNREEIVDDNPTVEALSGSSIILRPKDRQPDIKYFISTGDTVLNPLTSANLRTVKAVVNNQADERGFFSGITDSYETLTGNTYMKATGFIQNTSLTGGTVVGIQSGLTEGDYIMFKLTNTTLGALTPNSNNTPTPNLWYKINSVNGAEITVDRNLPDIDTPSSVSIQYFVYPAGEVKDAFGSGTTTAYWDTGTLDFAANCNVSVADVPIWNMNNVWSENLAGITGTTLPGYEDYKRFGSYRYLGQKEAYLELGLSGTSTDTSTAAFCEGTSIFDTAQKSLSLIHYTNNTISNFYGEYFYIDADNGKIFELHIPTMMYHRRTATTGSGDTMGMRFIATGATNYVGSSEIEYVDLIEDPAMVSGKTPQVIGRVYPQLKTVSIHNEEIIAATSYKSNRNWTLPGLDVVTKAPSGGASNGVLAKNKTMYVTYSLENNTGSGLTNNLPCQKYAKVTNNTASSKDIEFRIADVDLLPYMRKIEKAGYDGKGFYAYDFKLLYQIVEGEETRPVSDAWIEVDFTSSAITTTVGETIDPSLLENQTPASNGFLLTYALHQANSGNTYSIIQDLNMPLNSSPDSLQFGDERFFYGNIETYIGATIYKTIFDIRISDNFNQTSNPTRGAEETSPPNLRVSDVGIYDSDQNLVCIGKLSQPVKLSAGNTIMIEMSIDF